MPTSAVTPAIADPPSYADMVDQALAHYRAEELDAARAISERLLAIDPRDYAALHLAGVIARAQQRLPQASEFLKLALQCAPDPQSAAASWCGLGKALRDAGDLRQAEEAFRRALRTDPAVCGHAIELAQTYADGWKLDLAIETLKTAIKQHPDDPMPCAKLGNILIAYERQQDALVMYDLALKRKPDDANLHVTRGAILKMLGRFSEAESAIEEALRQNPMVDAYTHLVQLKKFDLDSPAVAAIKRQLEPENQAPLDTRINAGFALAKLYDGFGDYATAFRYLEQANQLKRATIRTPVLDEYRRMLEGISALFTSDFLARYSGKSQSDLAPIFILGVPRSGTTLTEQMLASHSHVRGGGELACIIKLSKDLGETWESRGAVAPGTDEMVAQDLAQAASRYTQLTAHLWQLRPRFTDKMPINLFYIGIIELLFPKAHIIYCRRNPVATCFSCYQHLFAAKNMPFSYDLKEMGQFYRLHEHMMVHWRAVLPGRVLEVDYEQLVEDPETGVRRMLDFCGLDFEPACLNFHALNRPIGTASVIQVRQPVYREAANHWQRYTPFLGPLFETLDLGPAAAPTS